MHRLIVIVALVISTPVEPQTQKDAAPMAAELASLDQQWQEAVVRGDAGFIEKRTGSSFVFTHGDVALVFGRLDVRVPGRPDSGPYCYAGLEPPH